MATPHNHAEMGEIAKIVIMPGDPLRAKLIAEKYLEEPVLFNDVRNMFGYTGRYEGREISVMGSGMGMPSMGIYAYELYTKYDVEAIIRVGSAGSYCQEYSLFDTVLVTGSFSESSYARVQSGYDGQWTYPDKELNDLITKTANELSICLKQGKIHSTDVFYRMGNQDYYKKLWEEQGCAGVEMESFALFHTAYVCKKKAACLLTISDSFVTKAETTAQQRQKSFTDMIEIALKTAKKMKI